MNSAYPIGLESVTYGGQDLASARFIKDFGLTQADHSQRRATFLTVEENAVHVRLSNDTGLPPTIEDDSTIREVVWGVRSKGDLETIAAELSKDREVSKGADGRLCSTDPNGLTTSFQVTERKVPPPQAPMEHAVNARTQFYNRVTPNRLQHVAFYRPNLHEMAEVYKNRLGFQVSDNHLAFRLMDIDEIMVGKQFLEQTDGGQCRGRDGTWSAQNLYHYFANRCGGFIEYFADMDYITDPRAWTRARMAPDPRGDFSVGPALPQEMMK